MEEQMSVKNNERIEKLACFIMKIGISREPRQFDSKIKIYPILDPFFEGFVTN